MRQRDEAPILKLTVGDAEVAELVRGDFAVLQLRHEVAPALVFKELVVLLEILPEVHPSARASPQVVAEHGSQL